VAGNTRLVSAGALLVVVSLVGCGGAPPGDAVAAVRLDPCRPVVLALDATATAGQRAGARAALDAWGVVPGLRGDVASADDAPAGVRVHFRAAAAPSHGYFDPASGQLWINEALEAGPLAVTLAHELGHAFGLPHISGRASVMAPGNVDVSPNADDAAAIASTWGACAPSAP
jgi:hypothetical protein